MTMRDFLSTILWLFALAAIMLVLQACDGCDSGDATFMEVCEIDGRFYYPYKNEITARGCDDPAPVVWPTLPLRVEVEPDLATDYQASVDEAIDFWEGEVDLDLFVIAGTGAPPDVTIRIGAVDGEAIAATHHERRDDGSLAAFIDLQRPGDVSEAYYVIAHELGHVLSLAHDPSGVSIMRPELDVGLINFDGEEDEGGFQPILVTSNDRRALREIYAP